jgi:hypothetical protein
VNFLGNRCIPPVKVSTASLKEMARVFRMGYRVTTQNMVNSKVFIITKVISTGLFLILFLFLLILFSSLLI